jgi:hypothetical protein
MKVVRPKASDSQSDPSGLEVRRYGLKQQIIQKGLSFLDNYLFVTLYQGTLVFSE